ncbi:hypothetical protein F2P81_021360 [Scophthalmus maximus]|uniref:Uncharacterized protein n=1 Tax=Scophthalmus maximus TaxID=52904 RepID=A0A6A4RWY6_SCOMX|nr:hypothetical protein F2P81_021360 [Scophthalmus maximus]
MVSPRRWSHSSSSEEKQEGGERLSEALTRAAWKISSCDITILRDMYFLELAKLESNGGHAKCLAVVKGNYAVIRWYIRWKHTTQEPSANSTSSPQEDGKRKIWRRAAMTGEEKVAEECIELLQLDLISPPVSTMATDDYRVKNERPTA